MAGRVVLEREVMNLMTVKVVMGRWMRRGEVEGEGLWG